MERRRKITLNLIETLASIFPANKAVQGVLNRPGSTEPWERGMMSGVGWSGGVIASKAFHHIGK